MVEVDAMLEHDDVIARTNQPPPTLYQVSESRRMFAGVVEVGRLDDIIDVKTRDT